jgi:DNA-binding MarR family transcriptional regulator
MSMDLSRRFGFLVNDVARAYSHRFDKLAREQIGLSRAQCRLLGVLAWHKGGEPLTQAALAEQLDITPMGVTALCNRMAAAGWVRREPSASDGRANIISLEPKAEKALAAALRIGDALQTEAMAGFTAEEKARLMGLLKRVYTGLSVEAES